MPREADIVVVLARGCTDLARWSLSTCGRSAAAVVDDLARLALVARRMGCSIRLREPSAELSELLALAGLDEVVSGATGARPQPSGVEAVGEPEGGEQVGVEEVVVADDPVA